MFVSHDMPPVLAALRLATVAGLVQVLLAVKALSMKMRTLPHIEIAAIALVQLFLAVTILHFRTAAGRLFPRVLLSGLRIAFAHRSRSFLEFCLLKV